MSDVADAADIMRVFFTTGETLPEMKLFDDDDKNTMVGMEWSAASMLKVNEKTGKLSGQKWVKMVFFLTGFFVGKNENFHFPL